MKQFFTLLLTFTLFNLSAQTTSDFESFTVEQDSFLNGSDGNGGFSDGNIFLPNDYNAMWSSWSGWAISNMTDVTTPGFMNQYSAITGGGYDNSANYATSFISGASILNLQNDAVGEVVTGLYITNATYTYLSMKDGDQFAKKFGGATGDDPDYLLLTIKGFSGGQLTTDSVNFYLADYRYADNTQDYLIDAWTFVDLTTLGQVDSLSFTMASTDNGTFGMNTPAYFCMDNVITSDGVVSADDIFQEDLFEIYPNPTADFIFIENKDAQEFNCSIFDMNGKRIYNNTFSNTKEQIQLAHLAKGIYFVEIQSGEKRGTQRIIKL